MSTSIFMCLSAKWGSLHHVDEACLSTNSRLLVLSVGPVRMFLVLGAKNWRRVLLAIALESGVELPLDCFDCD